MNKKDSIKLGTALTFERSQQDLMIKEKGRLIDRYRIALADAIRRPMGVFPSSSEGLITENDVNDAEVRRIQAGK